MYRIRALAVMPAFALILAAALMPRPAMAYVECTVTPKHFYVSKAGGDKFISWVEGGHGTISGNSSGVKSAQAMVMMAMAGGNLMVVRYPDGTACNATAALDGLWLKR